MQPPAKIQKLTDCGNLNLQKKIISPVSTGHEKLGIQRETTLGQIAPPIVKS